MIQTRLNSGLFTREEIGIESGGAATIQHNGANDTAHENKQGNQKAGPQENATAQGISRGYGQQAIPPWWIRVITADDGDGGLGIYV
jgi:hypothetical protein